MLIEKLKDALIEYESSPGEKPKVYEIGCFVCGAEKGGFHKRDCRIFLDKFSPFMEKPKIWFADPNVKDRSFP